MRVAAANLQKLPPIFDTYRHPPPAIPLVAAGNPGGPAIAMIAGESTHRPEQDPSFSVAPAGPGGSPGDALDALDNDPPSSVDVNGRAALIGRA